LLVFRFLVNADAFKNSTGTCTKLFYLSGVFVPFFIKFPFFIKKNKINNKKQKNKKN